MADQGALRQAIGLADCCELMAATWRFPDGQLCAALCDGSYAADAHSCLEDAGASADALQRAARVLAQFEGRAAADLLPLLKREYSLLYMAPGPDVPVWPYEAPFRFVAEGREGVPTLFRAPVTLDVERHMREAGVLPKDARREPSDSVWNEFSFLAYAYGNVASAIEGGQAEDAQRWRGVVAAFCSQHVLRWLPDFAARTDAEIARKELGCEYAALAELTRVVLDALAADVQKGAGS